MSAPTGLTLTAKIFAMAGDTVLNGAGDTMTEATNALTEYNFSVTEALAGFYKCIAFDAGGNPIAKGVLYMQDNTSQYEVHDDMSLAIAAIDGKTLQQALRYIAATTAGKVSGAGTGTETFVGLDGSTNRLQATVSSGNRTAISYDP